MKDKLRETIILNLVMGRCPGCNNLRPARFVKEGKPIFMCFDCGLSWGLPPKTEERDSQL